MSRRSQVLLAAIVLVSGLAVAVHGEGKYPKNVVMLTTHSSPGGGSDVFLREMAPHLSRVLAASVVVDNLQGGSGARAMAALAKARPDGGMFYGIDLAVRKFRGLAGPKGTPAAVIAAWDAAIPKLLADPAYKKIYSKNGLEAGFVPHAQYIGFVSDFGRQTEAFLRETGVIR